MSVPVLLLVPADAREAAEPFLPGATWERHDTGQWVVSAEVEGERYVGLRAACPGVRVAGPDCPRVRDKVAARLNRSGDTPAAPTPAPEPEPAREAQTITAADVGPMPAAVDFNGQVKPIADLMPAPPEPIPAPPEPPKPPAKPDWRSLLKRS